MIAERIQQSYTNAKYYQFYTVATILEHVIDCFHTIVSDETNPYHPPLSWLTRKQLKPPKDELFLDLFEECSVPPKHQVANELVDEQDIDIGLTLGIRTRLEKCSRELRKSIVHRTKDGCSPLFMASKHGHYNIVKYLLDTCEADIEQKGRYDALEDHHVHSVSPIWVAAVSGHKNIVKLLIEHGANINSRSDTGSTPLRSVCYLCRDDDSPLIELTDVKNELPQEDTSKDVYFDVVKMLVESGADISLPNYNGGTCLINSIHNYKLTKFMIDHGSDINASDHKSQTALHYAIQQGRLEVTKLLLECGADPTLRTDLRDDALQLSCLGGHVEIFEHLIKTTKYPLKRLSDAYKLLGSSILELYYDLPKVRELWQLALEARREADNEFYGHQDSNIYSEPSIETCDSRRVEAYNSVSEFNNEIELQSLSADEFRIQSLIISERVLGSNHKETVQRLFYRGTFYISSSRPDRCIDLWIYALKLRLCHESIFQFESVFAAQAITKLFLDLLTQRQPVKHNDIHYVLSLLVDQLDECRKHLSFRPVYCLHQDLYDLLLGIVVNLLFALSCAIKEPSENAETRQLIKRLIQINPRTSNQSTLLHVCIAPGIFDGEAHKLVPLYRGKSDEGSSSFAKLISLLIDEGFEVDLVDCDGRSALQTLCLANIIGESDKKAIVKRLVECGAHVDRRTPTHEQDEMIRQALKEAGVDIVQHVTLACLAARKLAELKINFDENTLTRALKESIAMH